MGILHDELHRAIDERWTDESLITELLRRVFSFVGQVLAT
jgi:hypothetical protein